MTFQEFDNKFRKHVSTLPYERQLDLALDICKKLFFDYQRFYEENAWGHPGLLLDAIGLIEQSKVKRADRSLLATALKKVEEITPDTEDFTEAGYALNACTAVYYTLEFLLENKAAPIYYVGISLYDTIDARIQGEDNLPEEEIDRHPLMIGTRTYLLQGTP